MSSKAVYDKILRLSDAKFKEGIFVVPQIRKLMKDKNFKNALNMNEKAALEAFENVVKRVLSKKMP